MARRLPKGIEVKERRPFEEPVMLCGTCGEKNATHKCRIDVQKGLDYDHRTELYSVSYAGVRRLRP